MDRVVEQVRHWRDELLNLTRRDRVLYYRATKTASLLVESPSVTEVIDRLRSARSAGWHFFIPPEPDEDEELEEPTPFEQLRKSSELLTHKGDAKGLAAALRTLDRRTTQEFMDKGIWVLYLAVGFLHWVDPDTRDEVRSPVVLIPVKLDHASPRDPMRLVLADEDPVLNPALAVRMETDFAIELPELPELEDLELGSYLSSIREIVGPRGWYTAKDMAIDIFPLPFVCFGLGFRLFNLFTLRSEDELFGLRSRIHLAYDQEGVCLGSVQLITHQHNV